MARAGMLRAAARSSPGALGLLLMTMEISALGMRPAETLSARASKLEPRPLRRTPMRLSMKEKVNTSGEGDKIGVEKRGDITQSSQRKTTEGAEKTKRTPRERPLRLDQGRNGCATRRIGRKAKRGRGGFLL